MRLTPITVRLSTADINHSLAPVSPPHDAMAAAGYLDFEPPNELLGKVVVITGGATGIGRDVALNFARRGTNVALTYTPEEFRQARETLQELEACAVRAAIFELEADCLEACEFVMKEIAEHFGNMDVLVNASDQDATNNEHLRIICAALPFLEEGARIISAGASNRAARDAIATSVDFEFQELSKTLEKAMHDLGLRINFVDDGSPTTYLRLAAQ